MHAVRTVAAAHRGPTTSVTLSAPRRRLLDLLAEVQFGRIQALVIRDCEPVFDPPPVVVRTLKLGSGGNPPLPAGDPALRPAVVELFTHFSRIKNGVVHKIQVADGLPLLAEVEELRS